MYSELRTDAVINYLDSNGSLYLVLYEKEQQC